MREVASDWWRSFFNGATLEVWRATAPPADNEATAIETALALPAGSRILDVPCGHGRIAIELAARGHHVTGLDLVPEEIALGREKATERGVKVDFRVGDMRVDVPAENFDAAACFGNSFGYFTDDDNATFLSAVHAALRPGGRFLMDTNCTETLLPSLKDRESWQVGQSYFLAERTYRFETGRLDVQYTFVDPRGTDVREVTHRIYTYRELVALMQHCGFVDVRCMGSPEGAPVRLGGRLLVTGMREQRPRVSNPG